ncbi:MAG: GNAT family N-acetyltransferase [Armatimonadota bacterium]
MPSQSDELLLRPLRVDDSPTVAELYARQEPDGPPLSPLAVEPRGEAEQWAAERRGELAGYGTASPAWWVADAGIYSLEIRVEPAHYGRGVGFGLYAHLARRLEVRGAARLLGWVRADDERSRRFAQRRGLVETGQAVQEYHLRLSQATLAPYAGVEERLRQEGLRLASLAELSPHEAFLQALHRLASGEDPGGGASLPGFGSWRGAVLDGPGLSPESFWVALDAGVPVGMTFLRRLTETAAENDFTGVAPAYRGRGIAPVLKLAAIRWARRQGVEQFFTSSELDNAAMIRINRRLGYRPGPVRREVARTLG